MMFILYYLKMFLLFLTPKYERHASTPRNTCNQIAPPKTEANKA